MSGCTRGDNRPECRWRSAGAHTALRTICASALAETPDYEPKFDYKKQRRVEKCRLPNLGSRIAARFAKTGLIKDIPELHGQAPRPALHRKW